MLEVYGAREQPEPGVDAGLIVRHVTSPVHRATDLDAALSTLTGVLAPGDVVFTLGAGDITTLGPRIVADPALGSRSGSGEGS